MKKETNCNLTGNAYNWHCLDCMTRKIINLRSPDGALSRKLQLATFERMGEKMARKVIEILKGENNEN